MKTVHLMRNRAPRICRNFLRTLPSALLTFCLACSTTAVEDTAVEALAPVRPPVAKADYSLQVGDKLDIKFYFHPDLNETVRVRPDGKISLQLISETRVVGLSPEQLKNALIRKYAPKIKRPEIAVIVRTFATEKVFVGGEVSRPGVVTLAGPINVLQAIASVGGLKDSAYLDEVLIIRNSSSGRPELIFLDMEDVFEGSESRDNIMLAPLDVVYVPRSPISNVNRWVDQYIRKNLPLPFAFTVNP
ncbi:MAG: polysaccharide export protein [Bdellovibrionales bacterium]|nr:polysaccharide export protein [Bdellovibrionales bacterium]